MPARTGLPVSPDAMEFLIIVLGGILIVCGCYEVGKIILKHKEKGGKSTK